MKDNPRKRLLLSKSFWGSIIFALSLWGYSSLNQTYSSFVSIPLSFSLPENRAIENPLPSFISIEVKGTGWHLFNLFFFNNNKNCYVDLTNESLNDEKFSIDRSFLLKSIRDINNVEVKDVLPNVISITTGDVVSKSVPIISNINITPMENYTVVGNPLITPSHLTIKGNGKVINSINSWATDTQLFNDVNEDVNITVKLKDSLTNIIKLTKQFVSVSADIQKIADIVVDDVPITISSAFANEYDFYPKFVKVTVTGGINVLKEFDISSIKAVLAIDETGLITNYATTNVSAPKDVQVRLIQPDLIHVFKKVKSLKELQ